MTAPTTRLQVFNLPDLGEGLTDAEIVRWLVGVGDTVAVDQPVAEVETAKAVVEVPTPYAGRVATLHAGNGQVVEVGTPLITVEPLTDPAAETYREEERAGSGNVLIGYGTPEGPTRGRRRRPRIPAAQAPTPTAPPSPAQATAPKPAASGSAAGRTTVHRVVSPLVRRLARDSGLQLADITPTGPDGLITRGDVLRAAAAAVDTPTTLSAPATPAAPSAGTGERRTPLNGFRKAVAASLSRSRREVPEATVWVDVDATALWELRESQRTPTDPGPGLLAYLARFVVAGLRRYPVLNARLDTERDEIVEYDHIHLGLAVQGQRGLVVPAVLNAHTLTTDELDVAIRDVTGRAREGRSTAEELAAGTFTLNNYGGFGVDGSAAIINHPQVAILGFGRMIDRPWVVDGEIVPRKITQMSFVFDHRICDGGTAAGFMRTVADAIETPSSLLRRI
ncbi:dihydrolipoamide acetyltransferase family protein [Actinomadura rupiterrae]|uniref:dihydrolipoamide acetyltransferase family protein n=1 Tax=Actinomadura rupiterrae TaxID=559627 RepID=UPI0020A3DF14|nr:dihydrolipoamide acetyltransferase family protein [Actinomadura rupiterrae]MCP2342080.1 pyruvate dehydrogenase E2 component (dihydrolipoamide acetyltransferase) [Actinomadura rupiterrae]